MYWGFGGMHYVWWMFWVGSIFLFFSLATPVRRGRYSSLVRETPLDILHRRYAAGELTTAEFDERRERLSSPVGAARPLAPRGRSGAEQPGAPH